MTFTSNTVERDQLYFLSSNCRKFRY